MTDFRRVKRKTPRLKYVLRKFTVLGSVFLINGFVPFPVIAQDLMDFLPSILTAVRSNPLLINDAQGNQCTITLNQRALLDLHNQARVSGRRCGSSELPSVPALHWNCKIGVTASSHSDEMQANANLTHQGVNGSNAGSRLVANGYPWSRWGENIATGRITVNGTMTQWLESSSHCSNLMNARYREMGAAQDNVAGNYWTAVFATSQ